MKIGIDIDDVITQTSPVMLEYIEKYGKDIDFNNPITSKANILRGKFETDAAKEFIKEYGAEISAKEELNDGADKAISDLKHNGHEIHLITARSEEIIPDIEAVTIKYLSNMGIQYDQLHMGVFDKKQLCQELGIIIMVDDSTNTCESLADTTTIPILFTTEINARYDVGKIRRVKNWVELLNVIYKLI